MSKVRAHQRYRKADGSIVPGVTTITGRQLGWGKTPLIKWANNLGLKGIDSNKFVDDKADIGTLAHAFCTNHLLGKDTDTSDYTANQIDKAENSALSFFEWTKGKQIKPVLIEKSLVSEKHGYGGQVDIYADVDEVLELIDLKTGSGIYPEYSVQVAGGYEMLLSEHGYEVQRVRILNIPRAESESFLEKVIGERQREIAKLIFYHCLENHKLEKALSGRE